jgi:hypothetical protein
MATSRKKSNLFVREVKSVCSDLTRSFEKERWGDLLETLERVSEVGEKNGRREISIQAQSLRMSIESRAGVTETTPFREMSDQFDALITSLKIQLTHLAWTKEVIA